MLNASRAKRLRTYVWLGVRALALLLAGLNALGITGSNGLLGHKRPADMQTPVVPARTPL